MKLALAPSPMCRICRRTELGSLAEKDGFSFCKCFNCGYVFADPMPSQAELDQLYDASHFKSSYDPNGAENPDLLAKRDIQYVQDAQVLTQFVTSGRLLDFGCGNGRFLGTFPDSFEKYGYELNPVTQEYLRRQNAFHVVGSRDELEAMNDGVFDAVTMRGVIEHLEDPLSAVELLCRKLKVGGHLLICATPNMDSPCALVNGTEWNQFNPPYHIHFFSPRSLALLFANHGVALIETRMPYLDTPYADPDADAKAFVDAARTYLEADTSARSPAFPGTMMTLTFRKVCT